MNQRMHEAGLSISRPLYETLSRAMEGTDITPAAFWGGLAAMVADMGPENRALLERREVLQRAVDAWHTARAGSPHDPDAYKTFLTEIGYLEPEGEDFAVCTENVDPEITSVAGPQLVVPITIARYALNAANARWGSLYDAL
ncbi:MAG: malate synthase G, partial [Desulfovibrionaceae bacterium]